MRDKQNNKPHWGDRLYQFRAPVGLDHQIKDVWDDKLNRTANIIRIMNHGIVALTTNQGDNK